MFGKKKYTCPCCGYLTLDAESPGSHLICPICFWEDDPLQYEDPDFTDGANLPSLKQAQRNFRRMGCSDPRLRLHVRPPGRKDRRDPDWQPFAPEG
ncbi:CPCC family cysteine-rich protein [Thiolapillus sp.]|uniref:CPCC family cysteine-rich protein n=1 Tax=Thiolapillus sp. TaxID=2017437 RepID=UPI0025ECD083|nr:CPCC family cysteine-rich protein [Thiolapillus sp.]